MTLSGSQKSDELFELIVAFVDREAGRDAPLTAADEAMVRRLIDEDSEVRALAGELRATTAGLGTLLDDVSAVEVPEELVALIRAHGASGVAVADTAVGKKRETTDGEGSKDGDVVAFRAPARRRTYGPLAAAASVALIVSCVALYALYTGREQLLADLGTARQEAAGLGQEVAAVDTEKERLEGLVSTHDAARQDALQQLSSAESDFRALEADHVALQDRLAALGSESGRLGDLAEQQRGELADAAQRLADAETTAVATQERLEARIAGLETDLDTLGRESANLADKLQIAEAASSTASAALSKVRGELAASTKTLAKAEEEASATEERLQARIASLTNVLDEFDQQAIELTNKLDLAPAKSAAANEELAELRDEKADLQRQMATLATEKEVLATARDEVQSRQAALRQEKEDLEQRLATVVAGLVAAEQGRQTAVEQVFGLEVELAASKSWLGQVAQYHRVYASTARRHLVEVGADELEHIQAWLTKMLGRQIVAPDLTDYGVTFAGARLLGINDKPVAQLVYLDAEDRPLAFCVIPSTGAVKNPTRSVNGELNVVDWRDGQHGYAVVGWSDPELLSSLTEAIRPVYDL